MSDSPVSPRAPVHYRLNQIAAEMGEAAVVQMCESYLAYVQSRRAGIEPGGAAWIPRTPDSSPRPSSPLVPGAPQRAARGFWNSPYISASPPPAAPEFGEVDAPPPLPEPAEPAVFLAGGAAAAAAPWPPLAAVAGEEEEDAPPPLPEPARAASPPPSRPAERVGDRTAERLSAIATTEQEIRDMIDGRVPFIHHRMNQLLVTLKSLDPLNTRFCPRHNAHAADLGGPTLGYSANSRGDYGWYAPSCSGCHYGQEEEERIRTEAEEEAAATAHAAAPAPTHTLIGGVAVPVEEALAAGAALAAAPTRW
jgi:hypothetical protein